MTRWDLLLFDLGGVIINFDGTSPMKKLTNNRMDAESIRRMWLISPAVCEYQTGRSDDETFARKFIAENKLEIEPQEFVDYFWILATGINARRAGIAAPASPDL
jgi:glucose-1-phosphatase